MTKTVRVSFMGQKRDSFSTFSDYVAIIFLFSADLLRLIFTRNEDERRKQRKKGRIRIQREVELDVFIEKLM